jgi:predicted nucleic acid-binding protein
VPSEVLVLVDTSAWIEGLSPRGEEAYAKAVASLLLARRAAVCEVVVAELLQGARSDAHLERLNRALSVAAPLDMAGTGAVAARLSRELRSRGRAIPTTDLLIAATCAMHGAGLLHRDQHLALAAEVLGITQHPVP